MQTKSPNGNVFTPVCQSFFTGASVAGGGASMAGGTHVRGHAWGRGVCMAGVWRACMVGGVHGRGCFISVFTDIYVIINKAFGLPKPSLFCNVQRDVASLSSYSKLNSKRNRWNSHVLPRLLLIGSC